MNYIASGATMTNGFVSTKSLSLNTSTKTNVGLVVLTVVGYDGSAGQGEDSCTGVTYNSVPLTAGTEIRGGVALPKTKHKLFWGVFASGGNFSIEGTWATNGSQPGLIAIAFDNVASIAGEVTSTSSTEHPSGTFTTTAGKKVVALGTYDVGHNAVQGTSVNEQLDVSSAFGGLNSVYAADKDAVGASTSIDWTWDLAGGWSVLAGVVLTGASGSTFTGRRKLLMGVG